MTTQQYSISAFYSFYSSDCRRSSLYFPPSWWGKWGAGLGDNYGSVAWLSDLFKDIILPLKGIQRQSSGIVLRFCGNIVCGQCFWLVTDVDMSDLFVVLASAIIAPWCGKPAASVGVVLAGVFLLDYITG